MTIMFNSSGGSCEIFYVDVMNLNIQNERYGDPKPCSVKILKKEKIEESEDEHWVMVEERIIILNRFTVGNTNFLLRLYENMREQYTYNVYRSMFFAGGEKIEVSIDGEFATFYTESSETDGLNGEIIWADSPSEFYIPHSELYNYKVDVYDKNQNKIDIVEYNSGPQAVSISSLETKNIWGMENVLVNKISPTNFFYMLVSSSLKNKEVSTRQVINANGCIITISQLVRPTFENVFMDKNNPQELYDKSYACQF